MRKTLLLLITVASLSAGATEPSATTKPATARAAGAATQPALTLAESDRLYARRAEEAAQQFQEAMHAARRERLRQLRAIQDKMMAAKDLAAANRIQELIAVTEAEFQAAAQGRRQESLTLRIAGKIDGKALLIVRQDQARWHQQQYGFPTGLTLNASRWDPSRSETLDNTGPTTYLPTQVNFRRATLVKKTGRNLVEVVSGEDELRIAFDDTDPGAGNYELLIEFPPAGAAMP